MMTIHEAIEYLEQRISWASLKGDYDIFIQGRRADDLLALLKSLEEQEAQPVIVTTNAYGTKFYHCPKCNIDLYTYPRQRYCSQCGQKVKWE